MTTPILILSAFLVSLAFVLMRRRLTVPLRPLVMLHTALGALVPLNLGLLAEGLTWRGPVTGHIMGGLWWASGIVLYAAARDLSNGARIYGAVYVWVTLVALLVVAGRGIPAAIVLSIAIEPSVDRVVLDDDHQLDIRQAGVLGASPTLSVVRLVGFLWETADASQLDGPEGWYFDSVRVTPIGSAARYEVEVYENAERVGSDTLIIDAE